jgi:hypothetical protein
MDSIRRIAIWAPLVLGGGLLVMALVLHYPRVPLEVVPVPGVKGKGLSTNAVQPVPAQVPPIPKRSTDTEVARAAESIRLKSTYQNFRTALATGNGPLQDRLLPILARDRQAVLAIAQESLQTASTENDRILAERTLKALRN